MKSLPRRLVLGVKFICSVLLLIALVHSESPAYGASLTGVSNTNITMMTRNLYIGAAFDVLLSVQTPNDIPGRVAQVYA